MSKIKLRTHDDKSSVTHFLKHATTYKVISNLYADADLRVDFPISIVKEHVKYAKDFYKNQDNCKEVVQIDEDYLSNFIKEDVDKLLNFFKDNKQGLIYFGAEYDE